MSRVGVVEGLSMETISVASYWKREKAGRKRV
jgi:hypothetical protein